MIRKKVIASWYLVPYYSRISLRTNPTLPVLNEGWMERNNLLLKSGFPLKDLPGQIRIQFSTIHLHSFLI